MNDALRLDAVNLDCVVWQEGRHVRVVKCCDVPRPHNKTSAYNDVSGGKMGVDHGEIKVLTHCLWMARPFKGPANRISVSGNEYPQGTCPSPGEDEKLALSDHSDRWFDDYCRVWRLRYGKQGNHRCLFEVYHAIVFPVSDAKVLPGTSCKNSARREWYFLSEIEINSFCITNRTV